MLAEQEEQARQGRGSHDHATPCNWQAGRLAGLLFEHSDSQCPLPNATVNCRCQPSLPTAAATPMLSP